MKLDYHPKLTMILGPVRLIEILFLITMSLERLINIHADYHFHCVSKQVKAVLFVREKIASNMDVPVKQLLDTLILISNPAFAIRAGLRSKHPTFDNTLSAAYSNTHFR